jgi:hypothetical protein
LSREHDPDILNKKFTVENNSEYETGKILRIPAYLQSLDANKRSTYVPLVKVSCLEITILTHYYGA